MNKTLYLLLSVVCLSFCSSTYVNAQGGGVAVNTVGSPPDSSALFDVSSSSKGQLMPRMTTAQRNAIARPANGLTIFNTDCNVYNFNAGTPTSPNWATLNSSNALVAGVSISANPVGAICAGTSVTFTATPSNGINAPNYQWQLNGGNIGSNSASYTNANLNNGDVITCILSTNQACVTGSPATSNAINMTVNPIPSTPGSITGTNIICANSSGNIFSVSPVAGATSYNWTVPGDASIASGSGNTSITVTFGNDSGNITVVAVNSCGTSAASSMAISILGGSGSQTFTYTGGQQTFIVPQCVSSLTVTAYGAQGTAGSPLPSNPFGSTGGAGGNGGQATGTLAVTAGQTLYIYVGGQNGFNGGGLGGNGGGNWGPGGVGGGESDIRVGGTSFAHCVIIAGGGGGGGGAESTAPYGGSPGGTGGGATGGTGSVNATCSGCSDAGGGTQSTGGAGGQDSSCGGNCNAGTGSPGQGGQGLNYNSWAGGGGGGGYYGGGGGTSWDGGAGGGGGSGYTGGVSAGSMQNGVQTGNGQVVITW